MSDLGGPETERAARSCVRVEYESPDPPPIALVRLVSRGDDRRKLTARPFGDSTVLIDYERPERYRSVETTGGDLAVGANDLRVFAEALMALADQVRAEGLSR